MIIQLKGKVNYAITLDPTVWIFDDRKVELKDAFSKKEIEVVEDDTLTKAAEVFNREIYTRSNKPPVNKSINRFEREKILASTYVMPIVEFLKHAEVKDDAKSVILKTDSDDVIITIEQLAASNLLFAVEGKPLKDDGPVHLYFGDGSNKEKPIKNVKQIIID